MVLVFIATIQRWTKGKKLVIERKKYSLVYQENKRINEQQLNKINFKLLNMILERENTNLEVEGGNELR